VVTRRTQFDLTRALEREHILLGLKKALDHIDAVIRTQTLYVLKFEYELNDGIIELLSDYSPSEPLSVKSVDLTSDLSSDLLP
jgi:DNA gyrase subunit A